MSALSKVKTHILVCEHKDCLKRGGREAHKELKAALRESGLRPRVLVTKVDCLDQCDEGPVMVVYPEGVWYGRVDERAAREIVASHVAEGGVGRAGCRVLREMSSGEAEG